MRRPLAVLSLAASAALAVSVAPVTADAAIVLGRPYGERIVAASSSSFTIGLGRAAYATSYRMYSSTTRANVYVANIAHATSNYATGPQLTRSAMTYTAAPIYYRIKSMRGTSYKWGEIHVAGLRPATPTGVRVAATPGGFALRWNDQSTNSFVVAQATNAAMTENRTNRYIWGRHLQYTPYELAPGRTYYFRVYARNSGVWSAVPSAQVQAVSPVHRKEVRVLTYNILESHYAGTHEGDGIVASWAARKPGVIRLIRQSAAGVVGIQEAADWVGSPAGYGGHRQIDDLVRSMPEYGLARTETPPTEHYYYRTGNYILYRKADYRPYGTGGHWDMEAGRTAAYQILQNITTGVKVLFVSTHLAAPSGATYDAQRQRQTQVVIDKANALAASAHVPVVYTGDFNSNDVAANHAFDGPANAMRPVGVVDARDVALYRYNQWYNSANQYLRTAPAFGDSIDYVYTGPGVPVRSWGVIVDLSGGKFVGTIPSDHNPVWSTIDLTY